MLVLEGTLINVFETQKGHQGRQRVRRRIKNSGDVRKQAGKRRNSHGDGDFDRCRYFPLPQQEKLACARSCGFKRVSGKGVFKGSDLSVVGWDAELTRRTPNGAKKRRFWRS